MKAIGQGSIASILSIVLRVFSAVLWVLAGVGVLVGGITLLAAFGLQVPGVEIDRLSLTPAIALLANLTIAVTLAAAIIIVGRLRLIFATVAKGDPFVEENAQHLRVVWVTLAIWEIARYALGGAAAATMFFFTGQALPRQEVKVEVSLSVWFAVLALIVLAEVFREGARLRDEQKLTI